MVEQREPREPREPREHRYGYIGYQKYNMIRKVKRRKTKDRCICGHLKYGHSGWTGECHDVFEKPCECKKFVSEKSDEVVNGQS